MVVICKNCRFSQLLLYDLGMDMINKITVLGSGSFGLALAKLVSSNVDNVVLWGRSADDCDYINKYNKHPHKLSEVMLPENILATNDIKKALDGAEIVLVAVPMQALKEVMSLTKNYMSNAIIICTSKGMLDDLSLSVDIINNVMPYDIARNTCYLSGPSFALELAKKLPTALTIASVDSESTRTAQKILSTEHCRIYSSKDVIGVCCGGALKNIIAIAAGACNALGLGRNALSALITRGLWEVTKISVCMGAEEKTLTGLSGVGDLLLSCTDEMSRNYKLGVLLAKGFTFSKALSNINSVVEGANTVKAIPHLANKYGIDLPICSKVYQVLYENFLIKDAISDLLKRELKAEFT